MTIGREKDWQAWHWPEWEILAKERFGNKNVRVISVQFSPAKDWGKAPPPRVPVKTRELEPA